MARTTPHRIVVAGGGIAAMEFILALRALIGAGAAVTVVGPNAELVLRPSLVAAPRGHLALNG
jgi:sulfide:quinone oxidoreductase